MVIFWLTLALALVGFGSAWSNHFVNGFHFEDWNTITGNPAIRSLLNIPRFFIDPRTASAKFSQAAWHPLLTSIFAIDRTIPGNADPLLFLVQSFIGFFIPIGLVFAILRLIPGGNHYSSLFGAAIFGTHPIATSTLNQAARFDVVLGLTGILGALAIVIVWPHRMPAVISLHAPGGPQDAWNIFTSRMQPKINRWYRRLRATRFPFYAVPLVFGLLAFPAAAIFAPLMALYIYYFEPERDIRRVRPFAIFCGVFWVGQAAWTWHFASNVRQPLFAYWFTQPLVVLRALYFFLIPVNLTPVSVLGTVEHPWSLGAVAGYAGLAAIVWGAITLGRKSEWRPVAFGLWWFLLALAPAALLPGEHTESLEDAFFASVGLTFALSRAAAILGSRMRDTKWRTPALAGGLLLALTFFGICTRQTYLLNEVWKSEEILWQDVADKLPNDGHALVKYGGVILRSEDIDFFDVRLDKAFALLKRAAQLLPGDAEAQTQLALAFEKKASDAEAEKTYRSVIKSSPAYPEVYALFAHYLLRRNRMPEAMDIATQGLRLDPSSVDCRQVIADVYLSKADWKNASDAATGILKLDPDSEDGQRTSKVALAGLAFRGKVESAVAHAPTVEGYLALSANDYTDQKYADAVEACKMALKLNPSLVEAWVNMATAYHAMGRADETIIALREAARLRPDLDFVRNNLDWELAHKGQPAGDNK